MVNRSRIDITSLRSNYARLCGYLDRLGWLPNVLMRTTVGFMFFSGAVGKLSDTGKFVAMFESLGIPMPQIAAPVVAVVELVGGVALMAGLAIRATSLVLAMDMVGALITDIGPDLAHKYPDGWTFLSNLFYSSEWVLIGLLMFFVCLGAGPASLDALIDRRLAVSEAG